MEFRVLGPLVVLRAGELVTVKSAKARELLAVLLLAPGQRASHASIMGYLWPGEDSNANRIRQYFHKLRSSVPAIAVERNETGFCQLQVDPQSIDYIRFQERLRTADAAASALARLKALRSALDECRGTPLEDMTGEEFERKRAELDAELRNATAACVVAELERGEIHAGLDRVSSALIRWPGSEALLKLKIRALQALSRQGEIEPLLARWEQRFGRSTVHLLLADETEGPDRATTGTHPVSGSSRPRQLPSRPVGLVGRRSPCERLEEIVLGRTPGRSRIAVISGMPGVGKTFLAVEVAARVEPCFPDGILYVDLRGFSQGEPEQHGHVLARFLNDLGVRPKTPTIDGMVSAYRTALADRAVLLVLDNARDENHVRQLLPGLGPSAAIVTSRCQLHGLVIREGAELVDLAPLDREEAVELLQARLGENRMRVAVPFLDDLVEHCAGIPLALGIIAARIASRPAQALAGMVRELREEGTRLRSLHLRSANLGVRPSLETSHKRLSGSAARLLWQLALHPGPTVSWAALRGLELGDVAGVSNAIDELTQMSLVTEPVPERYALHDLIRVYVSELADQHGAEHSRVIERVLHFLLHNARACDCKLDPGRRLPIGEPREIEVVAPRSPADAMTWFESEYSTLTAAIRMAEKRGIDRYAWLLSMTLVTFQWRSGRYLDALTYLTSALIAARREAGPADVSMVHRMLSGTHRGLGNAVEAMRELRHAVQVSEKGGDLQGVALSRYVLGVLMRESGAPIDALEHFRAALSAFEQLGDSLGRGAALNGIGSAHYDLGQYDEGVEYCLRSLALLESTGDVNGQAHTLFSLGRIRMARGEHEPAIAGFERACRLYHSLSYGSREARTLVWLADALRGGGRCRESEEAIERARTLMRDLGESDLDGVVERLRSRP